MNQNIIKQNITIYNSTTWNELLLKMNSVNNVSAEFIEQEIDFANFIVIAAFDSVYGNGGHSIDITKIMEYDNKVVVSVENLKKGGPYSVMTQPYHIVKIAKTDKLISYE
jgi:hypothetical protein